MTDEHRGRLVVEYTDDGTCYKDKTTGLYILVTKLYGHDIWTATIQERAAYPFTYGPTEPEKVSGSKEFKGRAPRRRELTEWLDSVVQD
jgi:hypothetical protein